MSTGPIEPLDSEERARLRNLGNRASGIVKDILLARFQREPQNVSEEVRSAWWFGAFQPATQLPPFLLSAAASRLDDFLDELFRSQESAVLPSDDLTDPLFQEQRICELMDEFVQPNALRRAADALRESQTVDWGTLAKWELLPELRDVLNRLSANVRNKATAPTRSSDMAVEPPDRFRYGETSYAGLSGQHMKMLQCLLAQNKLHVAVRTFESEVWGVSEAPTPEAVRTALSRLNGFFRERSIPVSVHKQNDFVVLQTAPAT